MIKDVVQQSILGNQGGQDTLEYVGVALIAVIIVVVIWQTWEHTVEPALRRGSDVQ